MAEVLCFVTNVLWYKKQKEKHRPAHQKNIVLHIIAASLTSSSRRTFQRSSGARPPAWDPVAGDAGDFLARLVVGLDTSDSAANGSERSMVVVPCGWPTPSLKSDGSEACSAVERGLKQLLHLHLPGSALQIKSRSSIVNGR